MFISMAWHGTLVAPVLTLWIYCSLVLGRRCEHTNWSIKICCHVAMFILMARCRTEVAPVLTHWSCCSLALRISVCMQVVLYICRRVTMVILMAWRGTVEAPVLIHWSCCSLALCHQCQYASCSKHMLPYHHGHTNGLARHYGSSSADTLELLQSCAVPSVSVRKLFYTYVDMLSWSYWWLGVELW